MFCDVFTVVLHCEFFLPNHFPASAGPGTEYRGQATGMLDSQLCAQFMLQICRKNDEGKVTVRQSQLIFSAGLNLPNMIVKLFALVTGYCKNLFCIVFTVMLHCAFFFFFFQIIFKLARVVRLNEGQQNRQVNRRY